MPVLVHVLCLKSNLSYKFDWPETTHDNYIWPVIMSGDCLKIILSPVASSKTNVMNLMQSIKN